MATWKPVTVISTELAAGVLVTGNCPLQFLCPFCYLKLV